MPARAIAALIKSAGPWLGVIGVVFYVGVDRGGIDARLDMLARTDTVNMAVIHSALNALKVGQDSLSAGQRQTNCYVLHNRAPGCR